MVKGGLIGQVCFSVKGFKMVKGHPTGCGPVCDTLCGPLLYKNKKIIKKIKKVKST